MTAEAVVLNKSAVAMAADSAVSIPRGASGRKIYDTANKLFELVKGRPVGIMVYSSALINGVPWETVIKCFRSEYSGFVGDELMDYVREFLRFLWDEDCFLFSEASEGVAFDSIASPIIERIARKIREGLESCINSRGNLVRSRLAALVEDAISQEEKDWSQIPEGPWTDLSEEKLRGAFEERAKSVIDRVFRPQLGLRPNQKKRIVSLLIDACRKEFKLADGSGLVIAGFGEKEPFPSLISFRIQGRLCNEVRLLMDEHLPIEHGGIGGQFRTYAQDEMALQFITGINGRTRKEVINYWSEWARTSVRDVRRRIKGKHPRLADGTVKQIGREYRDVTQAGVTEFLTHMTKFQEENFVQPLLRSIGVLPKDELAHMAETLVNLTSVIQRFSIHQDETVGGEIDVALISRGDGLVWMKRKHYFSLGLNPAWPMMHMGMDGVRALSEPVGARGAEAPSKGSEGGEVSPSGES